MSIQIKKKSKLYRIIDNPDIADLLIFGYLIHDIPLLISLDKIIGQAVLGRIRYHINAIYNAVKSEYRDNMPFHKKLIEKISPIISKTAKGEIKLEIPIYLEVNKLKKSTCFKLFYSYCIERKKKMQKYLWNSQFEVVEESNRTLWIYKEQHDKKQLPIYTSEVMPVRHDDIVTLMVPISIMGRVIKNLKFYPLQIYEKDTISRQNSFSDKQKVGQCQIQKLYEWISYDYFKNPIDFQIEDILQVYTGKQKHQGMLQTISIKKSSIENNYRLQMICRNKGQVRSVGQINKLQITDIDKNMVLMLKKKGAYTDANQQSIKLRVGDRIILYLVRL